MLDIPLELDSRAKTILLALARESIAHFFRTGGRMAAPPAEAPVLSQKAGAFVSLYQGEALRGCVGIPEPILPLQEAVLSSAYNAAFDDGRFYPLTEPELSRTWIEISCLTAPRPVQGPEEIVLGRHGMVLIKGKARAIFLPQVAVEQGWDLAETLSHLSLKAGLAADAWKQGCEFRVFEAVVFGEKD